MHDQAPRPSVSSRAELPGAPLQGGDRTRFLHITCGDVQGAVRIGHIEPRSRGILHFNATETMASKAFRSFKPADHSLRSDANLALRDDEDQTIE